MNDGYYLTKGDVGILREIVEKYRRGDFRSAEPEGLPPLQGRPDIIFGVADASIAGTSAALTTPGSGTLNVYDFTTTGGTTVTTRDETVYNLSTVARTTDEFTVAVRDYKSGKFMAVAGSGGSGYKPLCNFVLDAGFNSTDTSVAALLTEQFGEGTAHSTGAITVFNGPSDMFYGTSGTYGIAGWDSGTNWRILQLTRVCTS